MALVRQVGRVVTMDALLTQRPMAQPIVAAGGDDVMVVQEPQPQWREDMAIILALPPIRGAIRTIAEPVAGGPGRSGHRRLDTSDGLVGYSDGPGWAQVVQRTRQGSSKKTGAVRAEVVMGVTGLTSERAEAARVLALVRGHWHIANTSHGVRAVTFDEERSPVRGGHIPQLLATLRNTVIGLMRRAGATNIAAAGRRFAAQPACAREFIGIYLEN
jgi:predicted transposase YbfD/YdcC